MERHTRKRFIRFSNCISLLPVYPGMQKISRDVQNSERIQRFVVMLFLNAKHFSHNNDKAPMR